MARRPARARIHFVETHVELVRHTDGSHTRFVDYTVEVRRGQVRYSIGRIAGVTGRSPASWMALPIHNQGTHATAGWTRQHRTRALALVALFAGESCTDPRTFVDPAQLTAHQVGLLRVRHTRPVVRPALAPRTTGAAEDPADPAEFALAA